jgi:SAM-dependent methyltransferase
MRDVPSIIDVQEYWNNRPCNIRHSASPIGTRKYFEEVEYRKYMVESHIPEFSSFDSWANKKVLEIGCGIGTAGISFAKAGALYTGVELSRNSLDLAKSRFEVFGYKANFYQGNAEHLSDFLPIQEYDLIYSFGVIHHSPYPEKIVNQIQNYMNLNSEFRLMLYAKNSWKNIMIEAGFDQPEAQSGCPVAYTYSHEEVRSLLRGYKILDLHQAHIFPYVIEKYVKHEYEILPYFKSMPPEVFAALEKKLGWHTLIKCKLDQ